MRFLIQFNKNIFNTFYVLIAILITMQNNMNKIELEPQREVNKIQLK